MIQKTLTRLLPRRAVLAAGAAIVMAALPARAQEPVKVGMSGPFSGGLSLLGQSVRDGVEVAFAEINDAGGVGGRKLQFIAEDDGYEPMRTIASARKLVEQDKVVSLLPAPRHRQHCCRSWARARPRCCSLTRSRIR
jgi:Periplasmic binding protein